MRICEPRVPSTAERRYEPWVARFGVVISVALATVLLLAGCGGNAEGRRGLMVVTTTSIWADVAAEVVGDQGEVESLIPRGADSHDYQASPRQVALIREADLVVANGLGLEEGLEDVLSAARRDGANIVEIAPGLAPLTLGDDRLDPHVWFDPTRVAEGARLIADRLEEVEPDADWSRRADAYAVDLEALDVEIEETLAVVPSSRRKLVTNHESLGYFADRYDFDVVGVVIPGGSTLAQPSSAELAELVTRIAQEGVNAIFAETSSPARLAEAVATEAGEVAVVELHTESLGEPGSSTGTLMGILRFNAQTIADALGEPS